MRLFGWSSSYSVYMPEIDDEHRAMFRLADALHRGVLAGDAQDRLEDLVREMIVKAAAHFVHEERLMRESRYPAYAWHKRQHESLAAKAIEFEKELRAGNREAALPFLQALAEWLRGHTAVTDRMMASYLRNRRRERLALAG